jgi:hypothetical protein
MSVVDQSRTAAPRNSSTMSPRPPATRPGRVARAVAPLGTWPVWTVIAAGYLLFAGAFFASSLPFAIPRAEAACGETPLDVRFTSSATDVHRFLEACGPVGREAYRSMQLADLFYPAVFALFLASSIALVLRLLAPDRPRLLALAALPFLASAFDYTENVLAWRALAAFPSPAATDGLLGIASAAKSATSWVAGLALIVLLGALLLGRLLRVVGRARRRTEAGR